MSLRERRFSESQYQGLIKANKPTAKNPYATMADLGGEATTKVYRAIYTQFGTSEPQIVEVFENTYGNDPVFSYDGIGEFGIALTGVILDKTIFYGTENSATFAGGGELPLTMDTSSVVNYIVADTDSLVIRAWNNDANDLGVFPPGSYAYPKNNIQLSYIHIETKI